MAETFKSCSFCGKGENKVHSMFSAGTSNICDECVCYCYEMLFGPGYSKAQKKAGKRQELQPLSSMKLLKPLLCPVTGQTKISSSNHRKVR